MPYARVRGIDLYYREYGSPDDPPLIVAHGLLGSVAFMSRFDERPEDIAARGLRVIAYDARGHGRSGYTKRRRDYRWDSLAEDMFGLMQALGIRRASVSGGSMGAGTALMLALAHPGVVDRLILRAPPPVGEDLKPVRRMFGGLATLYQLFGAGATARIVTALPAMRRVQEANARNELRSFFASQRRAAIVPAIRGLVLDWELPVERFTEIRQPALILTHPDDIVHPLASGELLRERMPHAKLAVAPSQRYWQEHPEGLTHVIAAFAKGEPVAEGLPDRVFHDHANEATPAGGAEAMSVATQVEAEVILVSGGTGFVGSAVVEELLRRGETVAVLGRHASKIRDRFGERVDAREGDVAEPQSLPPAMEGVDVVVNAVQFPNSPIENRRKGWTFEEVDLKGTRHQVDAAKAAGVRRFVYVSGVGAAKDAERHWFRFKWEAEKYLQDSGMEWCIVRPTWVYGPADVSLNRFVGFARRLPFVPMFGDGEQAMQPVFIDDVARVVGDAALRPEAAGRLFELGGPDVMSMNDVIASALDIAGRPKRVLHQPEFVGKAVASILSVLPSPPLSADAIDFITSPAVADNSAVVETLNPRLTPLREGLTTYLAPPTSSPS